MGLSSTEYDMHIMVLQIANVLNHVSYYVIAIKQNKICMQLHHPIKFYNLDDRQGKRGINVKKKILFAIHDASKL